MSTKLGDTGFEVWSRLEACFAIEYRNVSLSIVRDDNGYWLIKSNLFMPYGSHILPGQTFHKTLVEIDGERFYFPQLSSVSRTNDRGQAIGTSSFRVYGSFFRVNKDNILVPWEPATPWPPEYKAVVKDESSSWSSYVKDKLSKERSGKFMEYWWNKPAEMKYDHAENLLQECRNDLEVLRDGLSKLTTEWCTGNLKGSLSFDPFEAFLLVNKLLGVQYGVSPLKQITKTMDTMEAINKARLKQLQYGVTMLPTKLTTCCYTNCKNLIPVGELRCAECQAKIDSCEKGSTVVAVADDDKLAANVSGVSTWTVCCVCKGPIPPSASMTCCDKCANDVNKVMKVGVHTDTPAPNNCPLCHMTLPPGTRCGKCDLRLLTSKKSSVVTNTPAPNEVLENKQETWRDRPPLL